jgi:hypothetical protein
MRLDDPFTIGSARKANRASLRHSSFYGGRALSVKDFRNRESQPFWGTMIQPCDLVGKW